MKNKEDVCVSDRVSTDLGQTEEAVFEVVCLNPSEPASKIMDKYNLSEERLFEVLDSLMGRGLVEMAGEDEHGDCVWKVTDLGRLMLLKYVEIMRFDIMEAKLRGQSLERVEGLERKRKAFENAYRQCKTLFEEEDVGMEVRN